MHPPQCGRVPRRKQDQLKSFGPENDLWVTKTPKPGIGARATSARAAAPQPLRLAKISPQESSPSPHGPSSCMPGRRECGHQESGVARTGGRHERSPFGRIHRLATTLRCTHTAAIRVPFGSWPCSAWSRRVAQAPETGTEKNQESDDPPKPTADTSGSLTHSKRG